MMKKNILFIACMLTVLGLRAQPPKVPADPGAGFGRKTTVENSISVDQLYSSMKTAENKEMPVKLKGMVTEVCQMEGCWIRVQSPDGSLMVKMKDHSFLVPVILKGKNIVIDGIAQEKITSVEQLRHFAEDAGKTKAEIAKIIHPKKEILVEANGILVL